MPPEPPEEKPIPTDYWSLVRVPSGQSGWVLTRLISMAIPDEVAQYAEGHRIVSYLPLGYVQDEDQKKPIWLWTTVRGRQPFDFDSFRVFIWSLRRHRYETAFIARNVRRVFAGALEQCRLCGGKGAPAKSIPGSRCVWRRRTASGFDGSSRCSATSCDMPASARVKRRRRCTSRRRRERRRSRWRRLRLREGELFAEGEAEGEGLVQERKARTSGRPAISVDL